MNKLYMYFKITTMFIFIMVLYSILPVSYNKTFQNDVIVRPYLVENVKVEEEKKEEDVLAVVQEEKPKEEVKVETKVQPKVETKVETKTETKVVPKEEPKTSTTVTTKPKEETKVESIEEKYNLGTITISNSSFKRNLIMDDGTYFYLNHDLNGKYNGVGMPIIDFRTNFTGRKTILYAHSAKNGGSPFNYLQNYHNNKSFYNNHKYINISYGGENYTYEIFSVYVSLADDDYDEGLEYFRVMSYTDSEWDQRIKWYKGNSEYDTGVNVSGNDKILILQTCSMDDNYYHKYYRANLVVMAKLI